MSKNSYQRFQIAPKHPPIKIESTIDKIEIKTQRIERRSECEAAHYRASTTSVELSPYVTPCFWTAWNSHREYLRRLSYVWMNVSAADAEDALSVATIRAFEKYSSNVAQISNERAWFARLLHNICIDIHRSNKRRTKLTDKVKEVVTIDASENDNIDVTPEAELLNSELGKSITTAIHELPDKLQQPLIMRLVKGDEYDFIATKLDISNDNARKRVQQARAILRKKLSFLKD